MKPDEKPIGYWLKRLDSLIEQSFDALLADHQLTRRHWQMLNVLRDGADPAKALAPFWQDTDPHATATPPTAPRSDGPTALHQAGPATPDLAVADLAARGWTDGHRLSPAGEAAYAVLAERVRQYRATIAAGITEAEYATVIRVLRLMITNLEPANQHP